MAPMSKQVDLLDAKEPFGVPVVGSAILHVGLAGAIAALAFISGLLPHTTWGNANPGGAISASLVSSAPALPLPQDHPPTESVLATEKPSQAPAPPAPKAKPVEEEKAIPIATKTKQEKVKEAPPKQSTPTKQPPTKQDNRAQYGEGAPNMARSTPGGGANGPVTAAGDFGSRFGWYVAIIQRKVRESWYTPEIDPATPEGREAIVTFTLSRDGSPSDIRIATSSGSPTLDTSAKRAVQRVDTFGPLPPGYAGNSLTVAYTFTYTHPNH